VPALGELPVFAPGDAVSISDRVPIGHYRMPTYLRGKRATIEAVIRPMAVDNEQEAYGRNAGSKGYYYRVAVPMTEIWPNYSGSKKDSMRIEIFENWLERNADA
jgi:nitrile hydratase